MDAAASTDDELRRRALTFLFVGAGYAGIETFAELADMAFDACKWYPDSAVDMRWVMVEATGHILPEVSPAMASTREQLRHRGMEVRLNTRLTSVVGGHMVLDNGDRVRHRDRRVDRRRARPSTDQKPPTCPSTTSAGCHRSCR